MKPRVRFAPSPTGYLHVGGARTALFNWLFARQQGGVFVLRVEDTDDARNKKEHTDAIIEGMQYLGLDYDEGPFYQSDRFKDHASEAYNLMLRGRAYPLFADDFPEGRQRPARPECRIRAQFLKQLHDNTLLVGGDFYEAAKALMDRMEKEAYAIVFKVPDGYTRWEDLVHGDMVFNNDTIEDFVLVRSGGVPLYNMACTSDDVAHRITHVIRGDDHISNTPKQIMLYEAMEVEVPRFGHLPMILGPDGQRLSKRHGATSVQQYRDEGVLSSALTNFLALLGWNPGDDREVMELDELIQAFSVSRINRKAAVFDTVKLGWMNGQYIAQQDNHEVLTEVIRRLSAAQAFSLGERPNRWVQTFIENMKVRCRSYQEIVEILPLYLGGDVVYDEKARAKVDKDPNWREILQEVQEALATVFTGAEPKDLVVGALEQIALRRGVGMGKVAQPLRFALTGTNASPPIDVVVSLLGRELVNYRINKVLQPVSA